jgi:hypothetical protein
LYEEVKQDFEFGKVQHAVIMDLSCIARIENAGTPKQKITLYSKDKFDMIVKPIKYLQPKTSTKKGKTKTEYETENFLTSWIADSERREYINIVRNLNPEFNDKDYFNSWTGKFPIESFEPTQDDVLYNEWVVIRNELFDICSNYDTEIKDSLMNWTAQLVQMPWEKPPMIPFFQGLPGTGKSSFGNLLEGILWNYDMRGSKLVHTDTGLTPLLGVRFNDHFLETLVYQAEEVDKTNSATLMEQLKNHATSKWLNIEAKGQKTFTIDNVCRLIITTNNTTPLRIEEQERRILAVQVSNKRLGDKAFWDTFHKFVRNAQVMRREFDFFKSRDISAVDFRKIPETKFSKTLKEHFQDPIYQFIVDEADHLKSKEDYGDFILSSDLTNRYNEWRKKQGFQGSMSERTMKTILETKEPFRSMFEYKRKRDGRGYLINQQTLRGFVVKNIDQDEECEIEEEEDIKEI